MTDNVEARARTLMTGTGLVKTGLPISHTSLVGIWLLALLEAEAEEGKRPRLRSFDEALGFSWKLDP